jgi:ABC-type branched-subunit amino acid transport system substrate-binding protein
LLALFALALLAACSANPISTAPVVKIGLVAPFEGRQRDVGYDVIYAARLAVREWNQTAGPHDYRVELVALDDGGDPQRAPQMARTLTLDEGVLGVVGHWHAETTAAAREIYQEAELAFIAADPADSSAAPPADFVAAYEAVTPFDEQPGPNAWLAYQQVWQLFDAIQYAQQESGRMPTRAAVLDALNASAP